mmetsp:Transcript_15296/g.20180  ORF Transcript_15296/g.20180 Transcript_15296/m.20180 type:complete len:188 (+) Transcript_15296:161-724(+)
MNDHNDDTEPDQTAKILAFICHETSLFYERMAQKLKKIEQGVDIDEVMKTTIAFDSRPNPRRKVSKVKDPNAPSKPLNAYSMFVRDNKDKVREENPDMAPTDLFKQLGLLWAATPDSVKQEYRDKHARGLEQYKEDYAEYEETLPTSEGKKRPAKEIADGGDDDETEEPAVKKQDKTKRKATAHVEV